MTQPRIMVDSRETASGIPDLLRKKGANVQTRPLDVGDYVIADYAAERKTVRDFITSLYGGRLFDQARRLSEAYENPLLLVEGDIQETLADLRNPRVYWGTLLAMALNFNFKVFFTLDPEQTADLLYVLATQPHRKKTQTYPLIVKKPRMATTKDWQLALLESLPTIGPKRAEKLLSSFGTVRNVIRASKVELALKGGIGLTRAKKIQDVLDAQQHSRGGQKQTKLG